MKGSAEGRWESLSQRRRAMGCLLILGILAMGGVFIHRFGFTAATENVKRIRWILLLILLLMGATAGWTAVMVRRFTRRMGRTSVMDEEGIHVRNKIRAVLFTWRAVESWREKAGIISVRLITGDEILWGRSSLPAGSSLAGIRDMLQRHVAERERFSAF